MPDTKVVGSKPNISTLGVKIFYLIVLNRLFLRDLWKFDIVSGTLKRFTRLQVKYTEF